MLEKQFIGQIQEFDYSQGAIKLDALDRKIFYLLHKNSRFSYTTIAKALRISREVVSYRIQRMREQGILLESVTTLDHRKLGLRSYRIYFKFKRVLNEKELVTFLYNIPQITTILTCAGSYDLQVVITVYNEKEFRSVFQQIAQKYHLFIEKFEMTEILEQGLVGTNFLFKKEEITSLYRLLEHKGSSFEKELRKRKEETNLLPQLSTQDKNILEIIKLDSTLPIKELALTVGLSPISTQKRIQMMIAQGVILQFYTLFSLTKLGLQWWQVLFKFTAVDEKKFITFIEEHPNFIWYTKLFGKWDYQCSVYAKSNARFHEIMEEFFKEFGDTIMHYDSLVIYNQWKYVQRVF